MARKPKQSFDSWYSGIFGDRWPGLRAALAGDCVYFELTEGLKKPYFMNEASYLAAEALGVQPGDMVLDMCAAPGGKTLALTLALAGEGHIVANDRSSVRRARLHRVLDEHLPESFRAIVEVTGHDAARWGLHEVDTYDRVLLDAPCSSERHTINSPAHLARWSPARTRHLAAQAYAMLASAFLATKRGGVILYSTCALSPLENDKVVGRLLGKKTVSVEVVASAMGESTEYGIEIAPDRDAGRGPMYIAKLRKR